MQAYCLIRNQPWYRCEAFVAGLESAGHRTQLKRPSHPSKNTLLVIWNRYGEWHEIASTVEAAGGKVIVAENGYLGIGGTSPKFDVHPHGPKDWHYYALAMSHHNGGGAWPDGDGSRWDALKIELKPWRESNKGYLLICPNRSFGVPGRMMHPDWAQRKADALRKRFPGVEVRVRAHPGNNSPARPLSEDLLGARAVYVWSSTAGLHSLIDGIPTFSDAPFWVAKEAAWKDFEDSPPDRLPVFQRLAWAQWTLREIYAGIPFRHLLPAA